MFVSSKAFALCVRPLLLLSCLWPVAAGAVVPDAARALRAAAGLTAVTPPDLVLLDIAPGPGIDVVDAIRLARRAAGLEPLPLDYDFSFEDGMQGWYPRGTDLNDPPIEWSVAPSGDIAAGGIASVRLYLANYNDAGKIWMERPFRLRSNTRYTVTVRYAFASSAFGFVNLWRLITGVHTRPPETRDDLTYQGDTGNGADRDVGYLWRDKSYQFITATDPNAVLYVAIGIWGTWESPGTYFVDDVRISFVENA